MRRMRIACCIPNARNTHSEYVMLIAFPQQQRFHERATILRCTYINCLLINYCLWLSVEVMSLFLTCNEHSAIFCTDRGNFCFCQHSYELAGNASSITVVRWLHCVPCWATYLHVGLSLVIALEITEKGFVCLQFVTIAGVHKILKNLGATSKF